MTVNMNQNVTKVLKDSEKALQDAIRSSFQTLHVEMQSELLNKLQSPESGNGDVSSTRQFMNLIEDSFRGLPESQKPAMLEAFAKIHDENKNYYAGLSLRKP